MKPTPTTPPTTGKETTTRTHTHTWTRGLRRWAAILAATATLASGLTAGTAWADGTTGTDGTGTTQSQTTNGNGGDTKDTTGDNGQTGATTNNGSANGSDGTQTNDTSTQDDANADKVTLTIKTTGDTTTQDTDTLTLWRIGTYGTTPDDDYKARDLTVNPTSKATDDAIRTILGDKAGENPTATLWTQWTGDDKTLPTQDTADRLGELLDRHKDDKDEATATTPEATHDGPGDVRVPAGWYLVRDDKGTSHLAGTTPNDGHNPTDIKLGTLTIKDTGDAGKDTGGDTATAQADAQARQDADAQAQAQAEQDAASDAGSANAQATQEATGDTPTPADTGQPADASQFPDAHTGGPGVTTGDGNAGTDTTAQDPSATAPAGTTNPWDGTAFATPDANDTKQADTRQPLTIANTAWTTLMGRTFTLHRIGIYPAVPDGTTPTVAGLRPTPAGQRIQYELSRAIDGKASDGDATGPLWDKWTGTDGARLDQTLLDRLGDALADMTPEATIKGAGTAQVPTGWYLIRDDKGTSHLMGTTIDGQSPTGLTLGTLTVEGAGMMNLFGLRKAEPRTMALYGIGDGSAGTGGDNGAAVEGGIRANWVEADWDGDNLGKGTKDRNAIADQIDAAMRRKPGQRGLDTKGGGYPDNGWNHGTRDAVDTYTRALDECMTTGHYTDPAKCRFVGVGWATSDWDNNGGPGVRANVYQGKDNYANGGLWWTAYDSATGHKVYRHNGMQYNRADRFTSTGRSIDGLKDKAYDEATQGGKKASIIIIILGDDEPKPRYDLNVTTSRDDGSLKQFNVNGRTGSVRDHIVLTATNTWPATDSVVVCTSILYKDNNGLSYKNDKPDKESARKCQTATGNGNRWEADSPWFSAKDFGWQDGKWWSGHYAFRTWVDAYWHTENGQPVPGGDMHAPGFQHNGTTYRDFNGYGSGTEEFWLGNMRTAASGSTTTGNYSVYDTVYFYDSHNGYDPNNPGQNAPVPMNNSFRTWLYVDVDGVKNNKDGTVNPKGPNQWELVSFNDAEQHTKESDGPAADSGIVTEQKYGVGFGTVRLHAINPKDLRYEDGTLPRCTAKDSGVYDPNGTVRCVLSQWPNGDGITPATYSFKTKIGEDNANRGGHLYHNNSLNDPSETWQRKNWSMTTQAMLCSKQGMDDNKLDTKCGDGTAPAVGNAKPIHDTARLFDNENGLLYMMSAHDVQFRLNYSPTQYGGTKTDDNGGTDVTSKTLEAYPTTWGRHETKTEYGDGNLGKDKDTGHNYLPLRGPDFTPADLFGTADATWKAGYYWFDVWVDDIYVSELTLDDFDQCVKDGLDYQQCLAKKAKTPASRVEHSGVGDAQERFQLTLTVAGTTKVVANGKSAGNANPARDTLTLTGTNGGTDVKATATNVRFTLNWSSTMAGMEESTPVKATKATTTMAGPDITSPDFLPADLFGKDVKRWKPGAYWFDVAVDAGDISVGGQHPSVGLALSGAQDKAEQFTITTPPAVDVQLEALKHWKKGASSMLVGGFVAELYDGDKAEGTPAESVRFSALNDDGTEGKATFQTKKYKVDDLGNADSVTKTFTIREKPADDPNDTKGITYDATIHHVTVKVTIAQDGTMKAETTYDGKVWDGKDDTLPAFTNTYQPKPTSFPLEALKKLTDDQGTALTVKKGQFTFDLKDKDAKTLQSKTTQDGGKVTFDPISVDDKAMGGKATLGLDYTIVERKGTDPYMEYDLKPHTVHVEVKDDGEGSLKVESITYDGKKDANGKPQNGYVPTVTNTRHSRVMLPITGGMDPLVLAATAGTILLLGGGATMLLLKRRKATAHVGRHA